MKKLLLLFVSTLAISCSSDDDNSSSNISAISYLGVLTGSSGYYTINIPERGSASATIVFDGATYNLTSENYTPGQAIQNIKFTDSQTYEILVNANADGSNPMLIFTIPGHTIEYTVDLATGTNSVDLYEGTSASVNGSSFINSTYNLSINNTNNTFTILEKVTNASDTKQIGTTMRTNGTVAKSASTITFSFNGQTIPANLNGNTISGDDGQGFSFSFNKVN